MRIVLLCIFLPNISFAQIPFLIEKSDYIWLFGDQNEGGAVLDFNQSTLVSNNVSIPIDIDVTNSSISDQNGNLLFYTNGLTIANQFHEVVGNGDGLNPGDLSILFPDFYILNQGALFLQRPANNNTYFVFHNTLELPIPELQIDGYVSRVNYTRLDMGVEEIVSEKNIAIIEDTLSYIGTTATRHANGRDWWLLFPKFTSNEYYRVLFSENEIKVLENQVVGDTVISGLGQSVFAPDGSKYVRFNTLGDDLGQVVEVYDFDRCNGFLSNHITLSYNDSARVGGVAISSNSKFLYVSSMNHIYQYNLDTTNIEASRITVAEFDGFANPFPNNFFLAQLAPDDKIYINSSNSTEYLHRIEEPNRKGLACDVRQHSVLLAAENKFSLANNPYYALGPLDGSPCDTLGIDNHPLAYFRHTVGDLQVIFTDYSKLAPTAWNWDFGDGMTSQEVNPIHTYAGPGIYEVCLTVSNAFNSHTYCDSVMVFLTNSTALVHSPKIILYPNPTKDQFILEVQEVDQFLINGNLSILNMNGQVVQQEIIQGMQQVISIQGLAAGVYTIVLTIGESTIKEKIVIIQ